jgi:hypothetical protein
MKLGVIGSLGHGVLSNYILVYFEAETRLIGYRNVSIFWSK